MLIQAHPKTILIIGSGGQDGTLLKECIAATKDHYVGLKRNGIETNLDRADSLPFNAVDLLDYTQVRSIIEFLKPDEIYYLAAFHHSSQERVSDPQSLVQKSYETHAIGVYHFLEAIRNESPASRLFYAGSSLIYGLLANEDPNSEISHQNELTPFCPAEIYGISKTAGIQTCRAFRERFGIFASVGILYNHESKLRGSQFVSKKIVLSALKTKNGEPEILELGNISALVDWSDARDVIRAMLAILRSQQPDDFIVASGQLNSVRELARLAYLEVGLNYEDWVKEKKGILFRPQKPLCGNPEKIKKITGWEPMYDFGTMVRGMFQK